MIQPGSSKQSIMSAGIYVNSNFDGGNMDVIDIKPDGHIQMAIHEVRCPLMNSMFDFAAYAAPHRIFP